MTERTHTIATALLLSALLLAAPAAAADPAGSAAQGSTNKAEPVAGPKATGGAANIGQGETFQPEVARRISIDDLKKRMDKSEKVMLLDARGAPTGPVPKGAIHVPSSELEAWAKDRDKRTFIATYCA